MDASCKRWRELAAAVAPRLASLLAKKSLFIQTMAHGWRFEKVPRVLHVAVTLVEISFLRFKVKATIFTN